MTGEVIAQSEYDDLWAVHTQMVESAEAAARESRTTIDNLRTRVGNTTVALLGMIEDHKSESRLVEELHEVLNALAP